jgi:hypothetical protein
MFRRSKINRERRKIVREDRKYLEVRVRGFLHDYLSASDKEKDRYYEVVAGASAGCLPDDSILHFENLRLAEITAEKANAIAKRRLQAERDSYDPLERFITDAYATTAVAYRRAAGAYVEHKRMQQLGTAAVHLLTIATSATMAQSKDEPHEPIDPDTLRVRGD